MHQLDLPLDQIIQGDCLEVLAGLPEDSIDLVFADPPYNLQLQQELWRPNMTLVNGVDDEWDHFASFAAYDAFTRAWLSACRRVLKDTGTIWVIGTYHNIYRVGAILQDLGFWILNEIVWVKTNPMPNFRGVRFTNAHETLIWSQKHRKSSYTFNHFNMKALNEDLQMRSDWELPICSGMERIKINGEAVHSTQKPESLLYRVILSSSNPGDIILDPFFGTGTTGAVAKNLNRHWIGIEKEKNYIEIAKKRIDKLTLISDNEDVYKVKPRNQGFKIPFGKLLELGLLQPGMQIYLVPNGEIATVLADGHLISGELTGSIHSVASELLGTRCNGWMHWEYLDNETQKLEIIDFLRKKAENILTKVE